MTADDIREVVWCAGQVEVCLCHEALALRYGDFLSAAEWAEAAERHALDAFDYAGARS